VAARAALEDHEHLEKTTRLNRVELERLVVALRQRGLGVTDSQANFLLVDFHQDAEQVFHWLLREGVIVRPLAQYGLRSSARVSVGSQPQNDRLLAALDSVLR
jgi:histidinol-phosphate aminotransferase